MQFKTEIGDADIEVFVEFYYTPGRKAKISGPMEDSYPAVPAGMDMHSVVLSLQPQHELIDLLSDTTLELLRQRCLDHVEATEPLTK